MHAARIIGKRYVNRAGDAVEIRVSRCIREYRPGQHVRVYINCKDEKPFREMNLTSIPDDEYLSFAFKVSGSIWKRTLLSLKNIDDIWIKGPYGLFTLPDVHSRIAMVAYDIGITPFVSMVRYALSRHMHEIALLYISSDRDHAPYADELEAMVCSRFRLFELYPYSPEEVGLWVKEIMHGIDRWYIAGEPVYVRSMTYLLLESGVSRRMISSEEFIGYCSSIV